MAPTNAPFFYEISSTMLTKVANSTNATASTGADALGPYCSVGPVLTKLAEPLLLKKMIFKKKSFHLATFQLAPSLSSRPPSITA